MKKIKISETSYDFRKFGIGTTMLATHTDYNSIDQTGFYKMNNTALNAPSGGMFSLINIVQDINQTYQLAFRDNVIYFRRKWNGEWGTWRVV